MTADLDRDVSTQKQLTQLRQTLVQRFSEGELRTLCFDLGIDYESLSGTGKADKAREFVAHLERRGRLQELQALLAQHPENIPPTRRSPTDAGDALLDSGSLLVGGVIGLMVGVLGNLVAAWIQQDLLKNSFTPARIGIILGLTLLGIIIGAWWTRRQAATQTTQSPTENAPPAATGLWWQDVRLLWSRFKSRGRGIGLKGIFALGSHIDIDTRDDPEDRDA